MQKYINNQTESTARHNRQYTSMCITELKGGKVQNTACGRLT